MDSLLFITYSEGKPCRKSTYFYSNNRLFEKRWTLIPEFTGFIKLDTILTFSKVDTSFLYKSGMSFIPTFLDYEKADCIYITRKIGNEYLLIKQSTVETSFKEMFFYDENYNISKYIHSWKNNRYVYVKKK